MYLHKWPHPDYEKYFVEIAAMGELNADQNNVFLDDVSTKKIVQDIRKHIEGIFDSFVFV